ncbi:nuclear transport factor 2 family protein [Roseovarius sp. Pro17]|uniref:nuclear transport factor 2 family protein n=1 Tax=Roseovarius sp. Pro17 TaxID=3108175 RepID=UPI002D784B60|nr:nuclear transport factor 2 family protein [Roseovarius sp. Pro17]
MSAHNKPTRDDIIALEKSYWDAVQQKDGKRTAELSAKQALVTGARGVMIIPKDKMGKMTEESSWTIESYAFDDVNVTVPSADVAIIVYTVRQKMTMDGKTQEMKAAESSTWLKGKDGWECHAHSETILSDY